MTPTLPIIVPQPITNQRNGNPSGQKAPLQPKEVWANRDAPGRLRVFEVDHPATQELKKNLLRRVDQNVGDSTIFVPVDFEREDLRSNLLAAGLFSISLARVADFARPTRCCSTASPLLPFMDSAAFRPAGWRQCGRSCRSSYTHLRR
jgi:hypothetical protein